MGGLRSAGGCILSTPLFSYLRDSSKPENMQKGDNQNGKKVGDTFPNKERLNSLRLLRIGQKKVGEGAEGF